MECSKDDLFQFSCSVTRFSFLKEIERDLNPARGVSEIRVVEDLRSWQCCWLEIRLKRLSSVNYITKTIVIIIIIITHQTNYEAQPVYSVSGDNNLLPLHLREAIAKDKNVPKSFFKSLSLTWLVDFLVRFYFP